MTDFSLNMPHDLSTIPPAAAPTEGVGDLGAPVLVEDYSNTNNPSGMAAQAVESMEGTITEDGDDPYEPVAG